MLKMKQISRIAVWLYVFLIFVTSDNVMLMVSSLILAVGFLAAKASGGKLRVKWNAYFALELLFVGYCALQLVLGVAELKSLSFSAMRRLLINCIDEWMLFNILVQLDDEEDILSLLISPYSAGLILLIAIQAASGNLFTYRLTTGLDEIVSYRFLGLTIETGSATIIGHCAVSAFAFSIICYYGGKNKKYLIGALIATAALLLTSTRKGIAVACALIVLIPVFRSRNTKKLQRILQALAIVAIAAVMVMEIPALYNMIGSRFERMFVELFTDSAVDVSMNTRDILGSKAWEAFIARPVEGWGVNSFRELFNAGGVYSHNNYLELLVGTGLIGTGVFLSKYAYLLLSGVREYRLPDEKRRFLCESFILWLLMVWVMEYWQVAYYNERMIVHYIFVLAVFEKMRRDRRRRRMLG